VRITKSLRAAVRKILSATLYPEGTVRTILRGPCRGLRYRIFRDYGLSPIYGGWEPDAQQLMTKYVGPESIAYDLGANYGIHVLLMASRAKYVYAFEPVDDIRGELQQNITLNSLTNVEVVPFAVCERTGKQDFVRGSHNGGGHLLERPAPVLNGHSVDTVSLDDFVFARGNKAPNFIKIDVEGAESRVLIGAERVLKTARPTILIDLHNPDEDVAVGNILLENHYTAYRTGKTGQMTLVKDLTKGWPSSEGVWGQVIAFPIPEARFN